MLKTGVVLAALIAVCLAGCSQPAVCTPVGWLNTVDVATPDSRVAEVVCVDGCETPQSARSILRGWQVQVGIGEPESIVVAVLDEAGTELDRHEVDVVWQHVDHGPCGGPGRADPVTLPHRD
ncbi:hypothetical protein CLV46_1626 [Diaminobutyricimonas aerilata]|uniref:Uncharacterized protein n=1 Tax=Diaminobutyricimonas aerilata TaxID=1162967 RepID=A0A2M9CJK1_9MICO|nr:hypothetical protein [Diaminobutyricimonas aerilata]PJJ72064.1 hypothetical protein CLV46_1626 [Diaminobutyricimonas aerilata]